MQLSVYFGQQTILSSWSQEVQTGWRVNEAYLFFSPLSTLLLHCYDLYYMLSLFLMVFLSFISHTRSSYLYHVIIGTQLLVTTSSFLSFPSNPAQSFSTSRYIFSLILSCFPFFFFFFFFFFTSIPCWAS